MEELIVMTNYKASKYEQLVVAQRLHYSSLAVLSGFGTQHICHVLRA